jgi:uncharacterized protein (DUF934 family)
MSTVLRWRDGRAAIEADAWTALADEAVLPEQGKFILSLARWRKEQPALESARARIGVRIPNTEDVLALWPELSGQPLLALEWPASGDGRAFTQARLLRERCGYRGEIRAVGDVLRDQLQYMQRCGVDVFVPRADQDVDDCLRAFADFDLAYQATGDGLAQVWARRREASPVARG